MPGAGSPWRGGGAFGGLLAVTLVGVPGSASAGESKAQTSIQAQIGWTWVGRPEGRSHTVDLGGRWETVFGRSSPRDFGIGPYVEARTGGFHFGDYGGGLVAVLPVENTFPFWLGLGALGRREGGSWAPAGHAFLGWGSRSFNYQSVWGMVYGVTLDGVWHGGDRKGVDVVVAATLDAQALLYPWLLLVSWVRH